MFSQGPPRPDPPSRGRREPYSDEEIIEFMEKCIRSDWGRGFASGMRKYLSVRSSAENRMRIGEVVCAGVLAKPITAGQNRMDILEVWRESDKREEMIQEGF